MRVMVALLLLSTLAGCLDAGDDPGDAPEPDEEPTDLLAHRGDDVLDPATLGVPLEATWWPIGEDAREPTIAVTSDGSLYYAARDYEAPADGTPGITGTQTPIMKSTDEGRTWTEVSPRLPTGDREPPRSGDPMVVADPWTDRVFQIELYDLVCNWLAFTDDGGDSWTGNAKACGSLVVDHQTLTSGPSSTGIDLPVYPNMVYVCVNQIADSHCARSLDGGMSFETFHLVFPGLNDAGDVCGGIHGHALVDPSGTVYLPREYCGEAYVGISRDDGVTWELVRVDTGQGAVPDPNMAFDAAGNLYYAWTGADQRVYLTISGDQGRSWSEPVAISHPDLAYANHPSITAGDEGRIGFVYLGASTHVDDAGGWENVTWDSYMGVSLDALNATPTVVADRANPEGDPVYRGDCRFIRCGYIREFLDASVAPDGSFWGAFVDACLDTDERKYEAGPGDCNTEVGDYGQGNGHLGYAGHASGFSLYAGDRVVSGSG